MVKKSVRPKLEFRFYDIPKSEPILALTGPQWINEYDLPFEGYMHFHNYMEIGICYYGKGYLQLGEHREMYDCPKDGEIHAVCIIPSPYRIIHYQIRGPLRIGSGSILILKNTFGKWQEKTCFYLTR